MSVCGKLFQINDVVRLAVDMPEYGLIKGDIGTVVCEFTVPYVAFEIEFVGGKGESIAQLALRPEYLTFYE